MLSTPWVQAQITLLLALREAGDIFYADFSNVFNATFQPDDKIAFLHWKHNSEDIYNLQPLSSNQTNQL